MSRSQPASQDRFKLRSVAFFGRTLAEYLQMFALEIDELRGRKILDVASGPRAAVFDRRQQHAAASVGTEPHDQTGTLDGAGCYALSCIDLPDAAKTARRMGWDSNPRATFAAAGFQDRCIQPLCHPSEPGGCLGAAADRLRQSTAFSLGPAAAALTRFPSFLTVSPFPIIPTGTQDSWAASATG